MSATNFKDLNKEVNKIISNSEKDIVKGYKKSLDLIKKEIAKLYEKYSIDGRLTESEMQKYDRILKLERDLAKMITEMYKENDKVINASLRKTFLDTSKSVVTIVDKDIGKRLPSITKSFDVTKTVNKKMAGLHWKDRTAKYRSDLIYSIGKSVKEGIAQGDTYKSMAERLVKSMNIDISKATTIARTEASRVMNQAQKETLDNVNKAGVKMMKTWNSVSDERVRDNHSIMDGTTIPYEDDFVLPSGFSGPGPKLLDDDGSESINCRCFLSISFEEVKK